MADAVAARVLTIEGHAIPSLAESIPADFSAAVALILATPGRVIVSGKSVPIHDCLRAGVA